jgi:maltose-binding protein MalE
MSPRKIFFFIAVGILFVTLIVTVFYISGQKKTISTTQWSLKIWITDGTTESYAPLIEGFKKYAKEYAKTDIIIEKQPTDADRYRTLLLSTFTEWSGPDIFMLHSGEDAILETKIEPIPSDVLNFSDFDKRYDDIFQDLLSSTGSWKNKKTILKWVPLGYETLGVFYNKSMMREVPKTWNDLENLYHDSATDRYPSNIGLGPTYTPNMVDILPIWLSEGGSKSYTDMNNSADSLGSYLKYGTMTIGATSSDWGNNTDSVSGSLGSQKSQMTQQKSTTLDLFMRWDIAMIVGYPSLVLELEKSSKRAGSDSVSSVILTDHILQSSTQNSTNIGKYTYFGISKLTKNGPASLKFIEYLMTPEAQRLFSQEYPYIIPAQSEFYPSVESNTLSETLSRTKLSSFLPGNREKISVFQYWLKSRFERYLREGLDTTESPDISAITTKISREISCEIGATLGWSQSEECQSQ